MQLRKTFISHAYSLEKGSFDINAVEENGCWHPFFCTECLMRKSLKENSAYSTENMDETHMLPALYAKQNSQQYQNSPSE